MKLSTSLVTGMWHKRHRPHQALARAAATAGVVVLVWGLTRHGELGGAGGSSTSAAWLVWPGQSSTTAGAPAVAIAAADADAVDAVDADGGAAAAARSAPADADAAAVRECVAASLNYTVTHLKDFQAEAGAWALKSALLAMRGALVEGGAPGAAAAGGGGSFPPLVVDVGANKGQNVPMWRTIYGEATRLVLVEGNPATGEALQAEYGAKGDTVAVVRRLVSNATGVVNFRVPKGETSLERAAIQAESSVGLFSEEFDYVKLPVDTLDDIMANPELVPTGWVDPARKYPIDFLKTDTEGWDVTALQGAAGLLSRTRFVLWECHKLMALVNGPRTTHAQGAALLSDHGFESYKLAPQFVRFDGAFAMPELDEPANMGWHNCFAIRHDDPVRRLLLSRFNHLFQCVKPLGLLD